MSIGEKETIYSKHRDAYQTLMRGRVLMVSLLEALHIM